jgi:hypothetical protein
LDQNLLQVRQLRECSPLRFEQLQLEQHQNQERQVRELLLRLEQFVHRED